MGLLRKIAFLVLRTPRDRRNGAVLFVLMVFAAALEAIGVGLIMPFVALIQNPKVGETSGLLIRFRRIVGAETPTDLIFAFGITLAATFVLKSLYLSFVQWVQFRFVLGRQVSIAHDLVERYLGNDYAFHLKHNSAELIQNVILQVHFLVNHVLLSILVVAVEGLTILVVLGAMVFVERVLVPVVGVSVGVVAFLLYRALQRRSLELGVEEKEFQAQEIKWLQQGLGGIKEAQVIGVERYFLERFSKAATGFGRAAGLHQVTQVMPRYVLESLGVVALVAISLGMLARGRSADAVLPVLGVLAVAAVRMLPSASRIVAGLTTIRHHTPTAEALYDAFAGSDVKPPRSLVDRPLPAVPFERDFRLVDVDYTYPGAAEPSLRDVSLTIHKGESVAFVGGSGAGKTTIVDVVIGLLAPTAGRFEVDGKPLVGDEILSWRRRIGYIPQTVYLCDDSILHNVAFGVEPSNIDRSRVELAIDAARLRDLVESLPEGLDTFVGERGVRLSGGQRQRIGIARALYLQPEVLVLDEATSALDSKTENEVVEAIERIRSERTALIIAHRLSTVRGCDRLVFMKEGRIAHVGTWDELYSNNADFRHLVKLTEAPADGGPPLAAVATAASAS